MTLREKILALVEEEAKLLGEDLIGALYRNGWFDLKLVRWLEGEAGYQLFSDEYNHPSELEVTVVPGPFVPNQKLMRESLEKYYPDGKKSNETK